MSDHRMSWSVLGAFTNLKEEKNKCDVERERSRIRTNSYNFCTNGGTIWRVALFKTGEDRYVLVKAWLSGEDAIKWVEGREREKER